MAALAAEATDDEPRTSMISAPRLATRGMKTSRIHSRAASAPNCSSSSSTTGRPPAVACAMSGNCVAEWLPQMLTSRSWDTGACSASASCPSARLWSSLVSAVKRSRGTSGACALAMKAFVFAGLPDDDDPDVVGGAGVDRSALRGEDGAVRREQVAALHAGAAGPRPDEEPDVGAVEGAAGVIRHVHRLQQGERGVLQLERGALGGAESLRDLEQPQPHGRVGSEQLARRDAEQQGVADLSAGAGDGHCRE